MERPGIVVIGAGGHAKVCIETLRDQGLYEPRACVDGHSAETEVLGVAIAGGDDVLPGLLAEGLRHAFVAIGNNAVRERVGAKLRALGFELPSAIHPSALVSPTSRIGEGVLVMPRSVVNAQARIDDLAIINTGAIVEHDCIVGHAAHIAPGSVLTGNVHVGARSFLGAGTVARPGTRIAEDVVAGSGAVIVSDIAAGLVVVGVPARALSDKP